MCFISVKIQVMSIYGRKAHEPVNRLGLQLFYLLSETTLREDVLDNRKRRDVVGDRGGKKDKEQAKKQTTEKQKQKSKNKLDKQPKRTP